MGLSAPADFFQKRPQQTITITPLSTSVTLPEFDMRDNRYVRITWKIDSPFNDNANLYRIQIQGKSIQGTSWSTIGNNITTSQSVLGSGHRRNEHALVRAVISRATAPNSNVNVFILLHFF